VSGKRDYGSYLEDMVEASERIIMFSADAKDEELLLESSPLRGAILHNLVVLGEAAKHVPQSIADRRPEVPWGDIAGMRDWIVHNYFGIKGATILETVRSGVPAALPQLRSLLAEIDAERV
jgi:uncharacterized protein with HEPN domain